MNRLSSPLRLLPLALALTVGLGSIAISSTQAFADGGTIVTDSNFDQVKKSSADKPVIFVVSTTWCQYCKVLDPIINKLAQEDGGKTWTLGRVDGDKTKGVVNKLAVTGFPTMVPYSNQQEMRTPPRQSGLPGQGSPADVASYVKQVVEKGGGKKPTTNPTDTQRPKPGPTTGRPTETDRPRPYPTQPTVIPTDGPTGEPTVAPTDKPEPTDQPTPLPTEKPTNGPTVVPTVVPTDGPQPTPPGGGGDDVLKQVMELLKVIAGILGG